MLCRGNCTARWACGGSCLTQRSRLLVGGHAVWQASARTSRSRQPVDVEYLAGGQDKAAASTGSGKVQDGDAQWQWVLKAAMAAERTAAETQHVATDAPVQGRSLQRHRQQRAPATIRQGVGRGSLALPGFAQRFARCGGSTRQAGEPRRARNAAPNASRRAMVGWEPAHEVGCRSVLHSDAEPQAPMAESKLCALGCEAGNAAGAEPDISKEARHPCSSVACGGRQVGLASWRRMRTREQVQDMLCMSVIQESPHRLPCLTIRLQSRGTETLANLF